MEQLLLSTATDRALRDVDLSWLNGKKVFVEDKYLESYDKGYVVSAIRQRLLESGARLIPTNGQPDIIVEIRSGGLGMNTAETLVGLPAMGLPVPLAGPLQTPELALYKSQKADSYSKLALFAYQRDSGEFVRASGSLSGNSRFHLYKILGVSWKRTDIPEMKASKAKSADKEK